MDVNGNITGEYITEEPIVGSDVELTIDANIQAVAEKALKDDIEKFQTVDMRKNLRQKQGL